MSHDDPIHQLSHEHRYILKVVHGLSAIDQELEAGRMPDLARLRNIVAFLREFADQCHCLLYTSPSPRDKRQSRMPSSA